MPSTMFDSAIYRDMFGTPQMRAIFADEAFVAACVKTEVALAKAEAQCGVIPADAAKAIAAGANAQSFDLAKLKVEADNVGYPIVGIVHQMAKQCGEAGRYIHWGATTQDIMDTATVLQIREALTLVEMELSDLRKCLAGLALKHRDTAMAGRTHLQHALPVTFGYKVAIYLSMIVRHLERLSQLRPRVLVGQFAGAVGTLASLGGKGLEVQAAMMAELGLGQPAITWHSARDGLAETVAFLALIAGSLGKFATDVMLMMQTEVGEAFEPFVAGRGSSSTMPQKRNPISCELIVAMARITREQSSLMLDGMLADHERATGPWHLEWVALPTAFLAASSALRQANFMMGGLIVDAARMRKNLDVSGGLIVAEKVMMELAPHTGRGVAHDLVYDACRAAMDKGVLLLDALVAQKEITKHLDAKRLAELVDPARYVGLAGEMVDRVLAMERE